MKKTKQIAFAVALSLLALCPTVFGQVMGDTQFSKDNTNDIGKATSGRPRTIYVGTSVVTPSLVLNGTSAGSSNLGDGVYAQLTSNTTTVVAPAASGVITSFGSYVLATNTASSFVVTCSACAATSVVDCKIQAYGGTIGTNGIPITTVTSVSAGSFTITVVNAGTAALNGNLQIGYAIL